MPPWDTMGDAVTAGWAPALFPDRPRDDAGMFVFNLRLSRSFPGRSMFNSLFDLNRSMRSAYPDLACSLAVVATKEATEGCFKLKYGRAVGCQEATWRSAERIVDSDPLARENLHVNPDKRCLRTRTILSYRQWNDRTVALFHPNGWDGGLSSES
jgi:hypothetical protein